VGAKTGELQVSLFLDHECADIATVLALVHWHPAFNPSQYVTFSEPHCGQMRTVCAGFFLDSARTAASKFLEIFRDVVHVTDLPLCIILVHTKRLYTESVQW
jgi:hypothetical protein